MVLGSALLNSFLPPFAAVFGMSSAPFFFALVWKSSGAVGFLAFLLLLWRGRALSRVLWRRWLGLMKRPAFWLMTVGHVDIFFTMAVAGFVDISVVVVLLQLIPVMFILLAWASDLGRGSYRRPGLGVMALALVAALGAALAVSSETGTVVWESSWRSWVGAGLALLGVVIGACNAFALRLARDAVEGSVHPVLMSAAVGAFLSMVLVSSFLATPAFILSGGQWNGSTAVYALWALVAPPASGLLWRAANLRTPDLSVNVVGYMLPVFSMSWLWLAGLTRVESPALLAAGLLMVLCANLVLASGLWRGDARP